MAAATLVLVAFLADGAGELEDTALVVTALKGGLGGGTLASAKDLLDQIRRNPGLRKILADPYALSPERQAAYYRKALALAYCQPTVKGLFVFHTFDEIRLDGWQSGLYYADHTAKPSLAPFRQAVADLRAGKLTTCGR